jgi:hypothetical protein
MTDIDFDELDKAVNSAIGDKPTDSTPTPAPTTQLSVPQRRSSGKFMDVVPPSVSTKVNVSAPEVISREGSSIKPMTTEVIKEEQPVIAKVPEAPKPTEWPDPIDFQGPKDKEATPKPANNTDNEDADIDQISDDITKTIEQSNEPLDTPFLSDTKVEKRPLGAFSDDSAVKVEVANNIPAKEAEVSEVPKPVVEASEEPDVIEPEEPEEPEQSGKSTPVENVEAPAVPNAPEIPVAAPQVGSAPAAAKPIEQPTGPTSITQQYREQPSTSNQTSGTIYDTDAYHKALKPVKKKSSWWMVLWIVLLLAIGAGAGAVAYFLILPRLGL